MRVAEAMDSVPISARVHPSFDLGSVWTHCANIRSAVMDLPVMHIMHATSGVHLHSIRAYVRASFLYLSIH